MQQKKDKTLGEIARESMASKMVTKIEVRLLQWLVSDCRQYVLRDDLYTPAIVIGKLQE